MTTVLHPSAKYRFVALDGIRGLAAISVMVFHYTQNNGLNWMSGAWGAVDLFFILSGFVIMYSYGDKITAGMTFFNFMRVRIIRLWPLLFVGIFIGLTALCVHLLKYPQTTVAMHSVVTASILNMLFLPFINSIHWPFSENGMAYFYSGLVFPLNIPAWSLFFELFANILFFYVIPFYRKNILKVFIIAICALFLGLRVVLKVKNPGWETADFILGFPRAAYQFFLGILIFEYREYFTVKSKIPALVLAIITLCCYANGVGRVCLANAIVIAPLLVAFSSRISLVGLGAKICAFLGDLSYPLYIIHYPIFFLIHGCISFNGWHPTTQVLLISTLSICLSFSIVRADKFTRGILLQLTNPILSARSI